MGESTDIKAEGQCATCSHWDLSGTVRDMFGCPQPCAIEHKVREHFETEEDWMDHMSADDCPMYTDNRIKEVV